MTIRVECVARADCLLGEGPVWDAVGNRLFWVDIKKPALFAMSVPTGALRRWDMPEPLSAIGLCTGGGLIGAFRSGFGFIALDTGTVTPVGDTVSVPPGVRFNDGHVDSRGRFWAGTMDDTGREPVGHLYRLDGDHRIRQFDAGFVVTNGIDWTGDGRTLYFVETVARQIWAYRFDMDAGCPGPRRLFADLDADAGYPDGLTVDSTDHVWSVHWDGGRVTRYRPDGSIERVVRLPVPRTTSCCFGGADLATLFVTSASIGLEDVALNAAPLSGSVFAITGLGVRGRLPNMFNG